MAEALRALGHRIDPEPEELAVAAIAAYGGRTTGAGIAALTYDSVLDDDVSDRPAALPAGLRRLTFVGEGLTVDVEVSDGGAVSGRLVPPRPAEIGLRWPGGSFPVVTDELGRFSVAALPPGPVSIRCQTGASGPVITDWFTFQTAAMTSPVSGGPVGDSVEG